MTHSIQRFAAAAVALCLTVVINPSAHAEETTREHALARRLDRVRPQQELRFEAFGAGGLQGLAVRHTADSVWVRSFGEDRSLALADVRATWARGHAIASFAVIGALNGGTLAAGGSDRYDSSAKAGDFFVGAAIGAAVGAVIGSFIPEWHRLNVSGRGGAPRGGWGGIDDPKR